MQEIVEGIWIKVPTEKWASQVLSSFMINTLHSSTLLGKFQSADFRVSS